MSYIFAPGASLLSIVVASLTVVYVSVWASVPASSGQNTLTYTDKALIEVVPHSGTEMMVCKDGYAFDPYHHPERWSMCNSHGKRDKCPNHHPYMCNNPTGCAGNQDHCCQISERTCNTEGGVKTKTGVPRYSDVHPLPPVIIVTNENECNPHLTTFQNSSYIQCKNGDFVDREDIVAMGSPDICSEGGIHICPWMYPKLCYSYDYKTHNKQSTMNTHCAHVLSQCDVVVRDC